MSARHYFCLRLDSRPSVEVMAGVNAFGDSIDECDDTRLIFLLFDHSVGIA